MAYVLALRAAVPRPRSGGDRDEDVFPRHSFGFAKRLRAAGVPTTLIEVHGTGHTLDTPGQRPSSQQLTDTGTAFLVNTLS